MITQIEMDYFIEKNGPCKVQFSYEKKIDNALKKSRANKNVVRDFDIVQRTKVVGLLGLKYEEGVNIRRELVGLSPDFESEGLPWGQIWLKYPYYTFREKTKTYYLSLLDPETIKSQFYIMKDFLTTPVTKVQIESFLPSNYIKPVITDSKSQGLDAETKQVFKSYNFNNIDNLTFKEYLP